MPELDLSIGRINRPGKGKAIFEILALTGVKSLLLFFLGAFLIHLVLYKLMALGSYQAVIETTGDVIANTDISSTPIYLLDWRAIFDGRLFFDYPVDWALHFKNLIFTSIMVLLALVWSGGLSLIVGYNLARKPHASYWNMLSGLFTLLSGFPFFVVGLLIYKYFPIEPGDMSGGDILFRLLMGGLILGTCEGALGEWPRNYRTLFLELQSKTYFMAHHARGQSVLGIAFRSIRSYFWQSMATRISYLFGAVIIVEYALGFPALGYNFIENIKNPGMDFAYREAMISGLLILIIPLLVRMVITARLKYVELAKR